MQNGSEKPHSQFSTSEKNEGTAHDCGTGLFKVTPPASGNCRGRSTIFVNSWRLGKMAHWVTLTSTQKTNTPKMTYVVKILEL